NNLYWNNLSNAIDEFRGRYLGTTFTTLTDWQDTTGVDSLSKNGNTNFTNDDIYTLLLSSSAIDIGVDLPDRYNIDFIGTFRPQDSLGHGGSWDAGAYEYKYLVTGLSSDNSFLPKEFALDVYPNPFNPTAKIKVSLEKKSKIRIILYDILGSIVTSLADDTFDAGYYIFNFNGSNLSSGIYILTVERSTNFITKKIVLLK
ncbi:MAG: T9SS type A sorting domain-containing protein, partial [Ignavibacteria bacterium]|nr:T9SS type A sorting domain-containing protein [Ignavibacteria bacterium]